MIPVGLVAPVLIMSCHMVEIPIPGAHKRAAESARPPRPPLRVPHHLLGVRARRAPVGVLVVLVEGVGAPEDAVAVRARIALVALVELVLVPLPVELALETDITKSAPVRALGLGGTPVVASFCCSMCSWY